MSWTRAYVKAGLVYLLPSLDSPRKPRLLLSTLFADDSSCLPESQVLEAVRRLLPESRFYFWKTGRVRDIALIADTAAGRIGFNFSTTLTPLHRQWLPLLIALRRGLIQRAFLLHEGNWATLKENAVAVLPPAALLGNLRSWLLVRRTPYEVRRELGRLNGARHACLAPALPPR